jgi:ribosomal protein S18 acetylase RimI-like enzyme
MASRLEDITSLPSDLRSDQINVRSAVLADADNISKLGSQTFTETFGHSLTPRDLTSYLEDSYTPTRISQDLSDPRKQTVVACDIDDQLLGFAMVFQGDVEDCVSAEENPIELWRLYVHTDYHGRGIGRNMFKELELRAKQNGFKSMWLGVWEENFKAQAVYTRMGFKKIGKHYFTMGSCVQTDEIWIKSI